MPKVSVIVPVYKAEATIRRCVDSILGQTFNDFELLLIDDGSPDGSGAICDEYAATDSRVRVFHKANGGVSSARNLGLDNARGEWIAFCDSDDCVYNDWLQNFAEVLKEDKCRLIVQNVELIPSKTKINIESFEESLCSGLERLYHYELKGYLFNKLFSGDVIRENKLKLDERFNYWEDEEFIARYCNYIDAVSFTEKAGYIYYMPDWSTKYTEKHDMFDLLKSMWINYYKHCGDSLLSRVYLNDLTDELFNIYHTRSKRERRKRLKEYRQLVGNNVLKTRLFFLSKWIIYLDKSYVMSDFYIRNYLKLRSLI